MFYSNSKRHAAAETDPTQFRSIVASVTNIKKDFVISVEATAESSDPLFLGILRMLNKDPANAKVKSIQASPELLRAVSEKVVIHKSGDQAYIQLIARVDWSKLALAPELAEGLKKAIPKDSKLTLEEHAQIIGTKMGKVSEFSSYIEVEFNKGNWNDFSNGKEVSMRGTHVKGEDYLKYIEALHGTWLQYFAQGSVEKDVSRLQRRGNAQSRIIEPGEFIFSGSLSTGLVWETKDETIEIQVPLNIRAN